MKGNFYKINNTEQCYQLSQKMFWKNHFKYLYSFFSRSTWEKLTLCFRSYCDFFLPHLTLLEFWFGVDICTNLTTFKIIILWQRFANGILVI